MPDRVIYRHPEVNDAGCLSDLLGQLGYPTAVVELPDRLSAFAKFPKALALVAAIGEDVIGLVTSHIFPSIHATKPIALITSLVVSDKHRDKGIGSELVARAELWAAAEGAERVSVASGLQRVATHQFYERRGYGRSGVRFTKWL